MSGTSKYNTLALGGPPRQSLQADSAMGALLARNWWAIALRGAIAMGLLVLFPAGAVLAFVLVTAAWAPLTGGPMLAAAFRLHANHGRWWLALGGVMPLLWGALLVLSPLVGAVVLTWWLGVYAIAFGVVLLVLAFKLRGQSGGGTGAAATPQGV